MIINKEYLKKYSPIPLNYNLDEVLPYVSVAEEIWVKPLISEDLFDEIQAQVDENDLSEANATLLVDGKLWQYLSFAVVYEALPFIWSHVSEVGLTLGKSDNSESLSLKDITYIQQHLRGQVEFLKESVLKWLCERSESFPLFPVTNCPNCSCSTDKGLVKPNPRWGIYTTKRDCREIR